jgi:hypothetical protein
MADGFRAEYGPSHVLSEQYLSFLCGHHTPTTGSSAAYISSLTFALKALRFVDVGANVSLEVHRPAFFKGTYTRLRNSIRVKGIDVDIHGYGLVELHLAYQDGHTRHAYIWATHAPHMSQRGAPIILALEYLRKRHHISLYYY